LWLYLFPKEPGALVGTALEARLRGRTWDTVLVVDIGWQERAAQVAAHEGRVNSSRPWREPPVNGVVGQVPIANDEIGHGRVIIRARVHEIRDPGLKPVFENVIRPSMIHVPVIPLVALGNANP